MYGWQSCTKSHAVRLAGVTAVGRLAASVNCDPDCELTEALALCHGAGIIDSLVALLADKNLEMLDAALDALIQCVVHHACMCRCTAVAHWR